MTNLLRAAGAIALLSVAVFFGSLAWVAHQVSHQVEQLRQDVDAQITAARKDALVRSDRQLSEIRGHVMQRVDQALQEVHGVALMADQRTGQALELLDRRSGESLAEVKSIRSDLAPVLTQTAALEADVQASIDDLYWDVKASVGSATVAARGIAEASEALGKAAPAIARASTETSNQVAGITTDVHSFTSKFTGPRTKKQKAWDVIQGLLFVGARAGIR